MLSYQHIYHAGNPADVHKHAALAVALEYLCAKDKPLRYFETHSGRGLYDLSAPEAEKTGEARAGVLRLGDWFAPDHPYARALTAIRAEHGPMAYPGSPLIAAHLLRPGDRMALAELHPREFAALEQVMARIRPYTMVEKRDGIEMALSLTPPEPRRGFMLIDPPWERPEEYEEIPDLLRKLHRKWNVGVILMWYPILTDGRHLPMVAELARDLPAAEFHEVRFPPARPGHRMTGSGLAMLNPPWGLQAELDRLAALFAKL